MSENIKIVTLIIKERYFSEEQAGKKEDQKGVLLFVVRRRTIMFPKKCIYNFEKVKTWFTSWKGREIHKAMKFDIPLWLYEKKKDELKAFFDDIIIKNTHKI